MGKYVYVTKGNQCYYLTVGVPNNAVEVPDLKSNQREADPRIALHTGFASSTDESNEFVLLQIIRTYVSCCYICPSIALEKYNFGKVSRWTTSNFKSNWNFGGNKYTWCQVEKGWWICGNLLKMMRTISTNLIVITAKTMTASVNLAVSLKNSCEGAPF